MQRAIRKQASRPVLEWLEHRTLLTGPGGPGLPPVQEPLGPEVTGRLGPGGQLTVDIDMYDFGDPPAGTRLQTRRRQSMRSWIGVMGRPLEYRSRKTPVVFTNLGKGATLTASTNHPNTRFK